MSIFIIMLTCQMTTPELNTVMAKTVLLVFFLLILRQLMTVKRYHSKSMTGKTTLLLEKYRMEIYNNMRMSSKRCNSMLNYAFLEEPSKSSSMLNYAFLEEPSKSSSMLNYAFLEEPSKSSSMIGKTTSRLEKYREEIFFKMFSKRCNSMNDDPH